MKSMSIRCRNCNSQKVTLLTHADYSVALIGRHKVVFSSGDYVERSFRQLAEHVFADLVEDLKNDRITAGEVLGITVWDGGILEFRCNSCQQVFQDPFHLYLADELYLYIDKYLAGEIDILLEGFGTSLQMVLKFVERDSYVSTTIKDLQAFDHERFSYLEKLLYVRDHLKTIGGKGGAPALLAAYLELVALGLLTAFLFELLKHGTSRILKAFNRRKVRRIVDASVKKGQVDTHDINIEDLKEYLRSAKNLGDIDKKKLIDDIALSHAIRIRDEIIKDLNL